MFMQRLVLLSMLGSLAIPSLALAHNGGTTSYSSWIDMAGHLMLMTLKVINPGITL